MGQILSDVTAVLDYKDAKKDANNKRRQILEEISEDEAKKTNLVKKALATQRAKYGASGVNGESMTTGAVLKRIGGEVAEPYDAKYRANLTKLKSVKKTNQANLLKKFIKHFDELMG